MLVPRRRRVSRTHHAAMRAHARRSSCRSSIGSVSLIAVLDIDSDRAACVRRGRPRRTRAASCRWFADDARAADGVDHAASACRTSVGPCAALTYSGAMTIRGYSDRINHALAFAAKHHDRQVRKGTRLPYLTHPANVAVILTRYGQDEETVVARHPARRDRGLRARRLHARHARAAHRRQVRPDGARHRARRDAAAASTTTASSSRARSGKDDYLARLAARRERARWVCAADKIHNGSTILADLERTIDPDTVWSRFNVGRRRHGALVPSRLRATARARLRRRRSWTSCDASSRRSRRVAASSLAAEAARLRQRR